MRTRRCVAERVRVGLGDRSGVIWHVLAAPIDDDFAPILCDDTTGINLPSSPQTREPTCTECIAAMSRKKPADHQNRETK